MSQFFKNLFQKNNSENEPSPDENLDNTQSQTKIEDKVVIDEVEIRLSPPDDLNIKMVGFYELQKQLEACWLTLEDEDLPLVPRLLGRPGVGKTTLGYAVAKKMDRDVFIFQCTMDTRPEDLLVTPIIGDNHQIRYQASPLVSAMICGGTAILDEGNRMSEKSWASLAPLFDNRRYVESITAGIKIKAHPDFRCCVTMNDDSSTFEVPEYIMSRLQPQIFVDYPSQAEEKEILRINLPQSQEELIDRMAEFLAHAHQFDEPFSSRDGIHIIRYARRLYSQDQVSLEDALRKAIAQVLGAEALNYLDPDYQPTFNLMNDTWSGGFDEDDDELV